MMMMMIIIIITIIIMENSNSRHSLGDLGNPVERMGGIFWQMLT
jgi:hypothetical protein